MKKIFFVSVAMMILFSSCLHSFKKAPEGFEYKIVFSAGNKKVTDGDFIELWSDAEYKDAQLDTILETSSKIGTRTIKIDSLRLPPPYYKIFTDMGNQDSAIVRFATDSILDHGQSIPFMKKGEYLVQHFKIVNVYTSEAQADSAMRAEQVLAKAKDSIFEAQQLAVDTKIISDNLAKNNITAVKGAMGTFVAIHTPGTGPLIDTSVEVEVNYTGKSFDGKTFDSNTDPAFGHVQPFPVRMWLPLDKIQVIPGWPDGLKLLSKGAKATFYIPSSLAYGQRGAGGGKILANENLIFDIEVVDVVPRAQYEAKMLAMQQHYMDSIRHTQPAQQSPQQ